MQDTGLHEFSRQLAGLLDGTADPLRLIRAAQALFPCEAAFAVINRPDARPLYLADTYPDPASKAAVQRYVHTTYELNPVHNAIRSGLRSGVVRMADLAPDNWRATTADVIADDSEEISFRTPGWPQGLQEVSLLTDLGNGYVGEISLARYAVPGGVPDADLAPLRQILPLLAPAFRQCTPLADPAPQTKAPAPEAFGNDILTPREAEIVRLILKGHSSLSISLHLDIALPTVKSHRRNAYAKLGISTQQQLFRSYLEWHDR